MVTPRTNDVLEGAAVNVSTLLKGKGGDVATISENRTIADALSILRERRIGALVVTGLTGPLVGIFSERDVVRALAEKGPIALEDKIQDFMSSPVTTCTPATSVEELMGMMTAERIRHVPVLDNGALTGVISIGDVVKSRFEELEREKKELLDYVNGR
jgi:CBS domain-containing protein